MHLLRTFSKTHRKTVNAIQPDDKGNITGCKMHTVLCMISYVGLQWLNLNSEYLWSRGFYRKNDIHCWSLVCWNNINHIEWSCTLTNLRRVHLQLLFSSLILHAYNGWIWVECPQIFDKFWVMILSQTDVTIVWASLKHMRYLNHERTQIPSQSIKTRKNITSDWTFTMSSWPLKIAQKDY